MKYYNSIIEYCVENCLPKKVRFEYWFIKQDPDKIYKLPLCVNDFADSHSVIMRGGCKIEYDPRTNNFSVQPFGYHAAKIKNEGYAFAVMFCGANAWKALGRDLRVLPGDEIEINGHLKPQGAAAVKRCLSKL